LLTVERGSDMPPEILIHDSSDTVGVAAVEGIGAGQELTVWVMDTDETLTITSLDAIPLGHKIAMSDLSDGDTVIKYGNDIGRMVADCAKGSHVHVHNLKTKKW
jgi:(2R)-sulfolactate sulfo-lyase subunit alpha